MNKIFSHRLLGLIFIGLMIFSVWIINAVFSQRFISFDRVALTTSTTGLNLPSRADVKVRGVIVGQVLEAKAGSDTAELILGIKPDKIGQIPSNVTASILPKTLFGEKYVELSIPANAATSSLRDGSKITETALPIEVEKVLNDIYPLLRTVQPAELNYTLNAIATALEGRGEEIGANITTLDSYLKRLNPEIPALLEDLKLLSAVSGNYADVMPQIAATLRNTVKTGNTLVSREAKLNQFLKDTTAFSNSAKQFLDANGNNLIRLGQLSEPQLALLERYSPSFTCLINGLVKVSPRLANTFRGFTLHIELETLKKQPRGYNAGDRPVNGATNAPSCAGLPSPAGSQARPYPGGPNVNDGVDGLQRGDNQRTSTGFDHLNTAIAATAEDKALINSLTAPLLGVPFDEVTDLTSLLWGPLLAGTEVSVR